MLNELLASRALVVVPVDAARQVYQVLSLHGQRAGEIYARAVPMSVDEVLRRPGRKQVVLVTMLLQHIDASIAVNALRPFFAVGNSQTLSISLGTVGTNESLLLLGFT